MSVHKMKKIIFSLFVAVIIAFAAINFNISLRGESLSDLALANIEALARNEDGGSMPDDCGGCWVDHRCKVGNITYIFAYPKSGGKPCDC